MSRSGLSRRGLKRLHDTMAGYVDRGDIPGIVTLVARKDEVDVNVIGKLAREGDAPMRRDTIFRVASMTKPVVAVAAMILVEECRLRLEDPVDGLLPELADRKVLKRLDGPLDDVVPAQRSITLRDLLTFRAGHGMTVGPKTPIAEEADRLQLGQGAPKPAEFPPTDEWMRRLGTLPLMHQPGEKWLYHTGADILGVLVSRAAGMPLEAFLKERVFGPLGMRDTGFSVAAESLPRLSTSYWPDDSGALELFDDAEHSQWSRPPAFESGAGGLASTADDYLAFYRMLMDLGNYSGGRILSRSSIFAMTTDQITAEQKAASPFFDNFWDSHGWGLGLGVIVRRNGTSASPGSFGWDGGLGTSAWCDPSEDLIGIFLSQRGLVKWDAPQDFWTCLYAAIED